MIHVAIIGGGPAGLSAAACLGKRGIAYTLLERGSAPAAGLRRVDPAMKLFSPARLSRLPDMRFSVGGGSYLSLGEYVAALDEYRARHGIALVTGAEVTSVRRQGEGFAVTHAAPDGSEQTLLASHVINATGIVSAPRLPEEFDAGASALTWMHSLDVRAEHVAGARRLLVVGGGASAGEVLAIWLRVHRPGDRAWISLRSPLRVLPDRFLGIDTHYFGWLPEHLPARPLGPWLLSRDAMFGKTVPRAIRAGAIEQVPAVAAYERTAVRLTDGRVLEPDLLVLAVGFRHANAHLGALVERDSEGWPLARRCESTRTPRLFLLGARFARTLASPYLRGIARDAAYLARRIAREAPR
jgi:putative flavoprotein involved in K+ transport